MPLFEGPSAGWPNGWGEQVNEPQTREEEKALACCIARGRPLGRPA